MGETSNWGRLLSLKETHHAAVFWSFIQRSFSVQVCHTETFVVAPNQIPEDVSVQLVEFRSCSGIVMSPCISLCPCLSGSVIPRALWGKEPKSLSSWEFMKLNFALPVSLQLAAKGRCSHTATQSLFFLDLSTPAPG